MARHAAQIIVLAMAAVLVCSGSAGSAGSTFTGRDIFVMNADGTGLVDLTNNASFRFEADPDWSPDGTKIAYSSNDQIFVMNADGTNPHALITGTYAWGAPAWSPDGTKIAFTNGGIVVMNANGSDPVTLTGGPDYNPSWSPSGKEIAFSRSDDRGETYHIYSIRSDGSALRQLTAGTGKDSTPAWSPDGNKIAFSRWDSNTSDILVMNPDGSGETRLTNDRQADGTPAWAPDGTRIAFSRDPYADLNDDVDIFLMNADGSGLVDLTSNNQQWDRGPTWSPDGKKIAFARSDPWVLVPPPPPPPPSAQPPGPAPTTRRCRVPRTLGLRLAKARVRINRAGCAVGRVRRARSKRVGRVVSQSPRPGALLARGGKVRLVVGRET